MQERLVYIDTIGQETRRLVVEDGVPVEYAVAYQNQHSIVGNLYLGRVANIVKGMRAAFVDIGIGVNAFLSLDDLPGVARDLENASVRSSQPLRNGQEVIVQVVKEPGGAKGPKVNMNPTLPGQYVVLLPTISNVGVSRHITDLEERTRLMAAGQRICPKEMGLILRTAAENIDESILAREVAELATSWLHLQDRARTAKPPFLLFDDGDLVSRAERDLQASVIPGYFDDALETILEKQLRRKVWLKSGGYLVIDHCEAMTVIDVNSGKNTGKRTLDESILALNREAAVAVAHQIRLRDIGGIIVIDFVDMRRDEDKEAILVAFQDALSADRAKMHVHGFTGAGLLEMTRRPVFQPVKDSVSVACACCSGDGCVASPQARAHALLRMVRRKRMAGDTSVIQLRTSMDVAAALREIGMPEHTELCIEHKGECYEAH